MTSRVDDLGDRVYDLERKLGTQAAAQEAVAYKADSLAAQVDNNARVANENILKDATAAGECGRETYWETPSILRTRNIACTAETYFKRR